MFTENDYDRLHEIVFRSDYPGFKPAVKEIPNGDGNIDLDKRYAHVASKYLDLMPSSPEKGVLMEYLYRAFEHALNVASMLAVPEKFVPKYEFGALRVLEYPPGATTALHADFDLFTLLMYRDQATKLRFFDGDRDPWELDDVCKGLHIGEIGELIGLGPSTEHDVIASDTAQHSIVYFAIPDHAAVLSSGLTVGGWLTERMSRSRIGDYG